MLEKDKGDLLKVTSPSGREIAGTSLKDDLGQGSSKITEEEGGDDPMYKSQKLTLQDLHQSAEMKGSSRQLEHTPSAGSKQWSALFKPSVKPKEAKLKDVPRVKRKEEVFPGLSSNPSPSLHQGLSKLQLEQETRKLEGPSQSPPEEEWHVPVKVKGAKKEKKQRKKHESKDDPFDF